MSPGAVLGFRSELIFHRVDGEVIDLRAAHGCRLIRTAANPTYYWGNFLLFDRAPRAGDAPHWEQLFAQLIEQHQPQSTHRAYAWLEDAPGEIDAFTAQGFDRNDAVVMQRTGVPAVPPPKIDAKLTPFPLAGDAAGHAWSALHELHVATRGPEFDEAGYRTFSQRRIARWRAMAVAGRGNWLGAFVDEGGPDRRLAAALGIYAEAESEDGERLARFQTVMTDPAYRRRGLCRTLIAAAARYAHDVLRADRLIIVAMAGEMPEQLYASVGFTAAGLQRGLERHPPAA